ncbi:MAG: hypothetical protein JSU63_15060 [Phycisphaerales bacterium]|nr:MAG: hypothetical protein JSU63_15060 [Phycisphaerales bacterium]
MVRFSRWILAGCLIVTLVSAGCSTNPVVMAEYPHAMSPTLGQSPHEHYQGISNIAARDRRALIEDLDLLFLTDRPSRLSRWHDK